MVKATALIVFLLLFSLFAMAKPVELQIEGTDADTKDTAYQVQGPGKVNLTIKITNNIKKEEYNKPIDLVFVLDASLSMQQEINTVRDFVKPFSEKIEKKCAERGISDCLRIGAYVFEGTLDNKKVKVCETEEVPYQSCKIYKRVRYSCDSCKEWKKECTKKEWCSTTTTRECVEESEKSGTRTDRKCRKWSYVKECTTQCVDLDDVKDCTEKCHNVRRCTGGYHYTTVHYSYTSCDRYKYVSVETCHPYKSCSWKCVGGYVRTTCEKSVCAEYETKSRTQTRCKWVQVKTAFQKPKSQKPMDWANDVGEIYLTDNIELIQNNLAKVKVVNTKEPWGSIIEHVILAPEMGWRENASKVVILITDEDDDSLRFNEAAQVAKEKGVFVFGVIGIGPYANTAMNQALIIANETGGTVSKYTSASDIPDRIMDAVEKVIGSDALVFSREEGPSWDDITGNINIPPVAREGGTKELTLSIDAPSTYGKPIAYFRYRISVKNNPPIFDDGWLAVKVNTPPKADFEVHPQKGVAPLTVLFKDKTQDTGPLQSWNWDFGDGATSSEPNPTHVYTSEGPFTVKLRVVDAGGLEDTKTRKIYPYEYASVLRVNTKDITQEEEADINVECNKDLLKGTLRVVNNKTKNTVFEKKDYVCNSGTVLTPPITKAGVYLVTFKLNTPKCTACQKSKYFIVRNKNQKIKSPENPVIEALTSLALFGAIIALMPSAKKQNQ